MNAPVTGTEDLIYAVEDGIAKITFNRPQSRNAMTFAMYEQMASCLLYTSDAADE